MQNFEQLLSNLDLRLFEKIPSQSTDEDKRSFLALQAAVRELCSDYNYLEIGSYLGGSIQPHLVDKKCRRIYSIDKRPAQQPDERGIDYVYQNNSTARMIEQLKQVAPDDLSKLETIDGDTRELESYRVEDRVQFCFIDGEHTDEAVVSDFGFCLDVLDDDGIIAFHDAQITYNGIAECVSSLEKTGRNFRAYSLPNIVFVIEIGDFPVHRHAPVLDRLTNNYKSYLDSLQYNDTYRRFANRFPFKMMKRLYAGALKRNVCE